MKPNCSAASRYSPVSEQRNMAGSSEFSTIGTPASNNRRTGWSSMRLTTPVTRLLVMQISSGISRSRRWRISAGSSHRRDAVPDALRAERQRVPDGFRPHALAGVRVQVQSGVPWRMRRRP